MKTAELFEIRYNKPKARTTTWHETVPAGTPGAEEDITWDPTTSRWETGKWYLTHTGIRHDAEGKPILNKTYYDPGYRKGKYPAKGDILGTVGDWLELMGATREDLPKALEKVRQSPEYKHALALGFQDTSSTGELRNGTLNFIGEYEPIVGSDEKLGVVRRKVLANGNVRTYALDKPDSHQAGRGKVPHPHTVATDPHSTPVERIVKSMRNGIESFTKVFLASSKKHFLKSLKD